MADKLTSKNIIDRKWQELVQAGIDIDIIVEKMSPIAIRKNFYKLLDAGASIDAIGKKANPLLLALGIARSCVCSEDELSYSFYTLDEGKVLEELRIGLKCLIDLNLSEKIIADSCKRNLGFDHRFELLVLLSQDSKLQQLRPRICWKEYFKGKLGWCCDLYDFFEVVDHLHNDGKISYKEIIDYVLADEETFQEYFDSDSEYLGQVFATRSW